MLLLSERVPDSSALGGVEIHVADLACHVGAPVEVFGAHLRAGRVVVEKFRPVRRELSLLAARDLRAALTTTLLGLDIDVLHVHSPQLGPDELADVVQATGVRVVLSLHDLALSRLDASRLVRACDVVISPSRFIHDVTLAAHPGIAQRTRFVSWGVIQQERVPRTAAGRLRVAVVGVLAVEKGAARLPDLMRACAHLDIEWHLFGATEGRSLGAIREVATVHAHGAYRRSELGRLFAEAGIDLAMLASIVPESFSMTLSECISSGVPVVASNLGALAERVQDESCGWLFDPECPESLARVLEKLIDSRGLANVDRLERRTLPTPAIMAGLHEAIYVELAPVERPARVSPADRDRARRELEAARANGASALHGAWRALRRTKFYRELPLRRVLSEQLRAAAEQRAMAFVDRWKR